MTDDSLRHEQRGQFPRATRLNLNNYLTLGLGRFEREKKNLPPLTPQEPAIQVPRQTPPVSGRAGESGHCAVLWPSTTDQKELCVIPGAITLYIGNRGVACFTRSVTARSGLISPTGYLPQDLLPLVVMAKIPRTGRSRHLVDCLSMYGVCDTVHTVGLDLRVVKHEH